MQQPLQVTFHGLEHSDAVEARIRSKAEELDRLCERIVSCRVAVESPHQHQRHGRRYAVRIDLRIPGHEISVGRERHLNQAHEDIYVAIRDAFEAAGRQLKDYLGRRRDLAKQPA